MLYGLLHNETPLELGAPWERYLNASPRSFPKYTVALIFTEHLVPDCERLEARNRCFSFGFFFLSALYIQFRLGRQRNHNEFFVINSKSYSSFVMGQVLHNMLSVYLIFTAQQTYGIGNIFI